MDGPVLSNFIILSTVTCSIKKKYSPCPKSVYQGSLVINYSVLSCRKLKCSFPNVVQYCIFEHCNLVLV